jgi:hypothetical protein
MFGGFLAYKKYRKIPVQSVEVFCLVFISLVAVQYVRTPGWYRYFFPAHILLFVFFPAAFLSVGEWAAARGALWCKKIIFMIPLLFIVIQAGQFYYNEHLCAEDKTLPAIAQFSTLGPQEKVLFYNTPELVFLFPRLDVYQYLRITDTIEVGKESFAKIEQGFYDRVILPTANFERGDIQGSCYIKDATAGDYTFLKRSYEHCKS